VRCTGRARGGPEAAAFPPRRTGHIALLFAVFMAFGTLAGALAVDEGALYLQRRTAQSAVDLAAISAAAIPRTLFALAR